MNCKFCNRLCKNGNSLRNHERLCSLNSNRQFTPFQNLHFQRSKKSGNQYLKAERLGLPKPKISESTRQKLILANKNRSKELRKKHSEVVSKTIREKVINGTWHVSLAKNLHFEYKGEDLHGKWELKYAIYLDKNNIQWKRNKERFKYIFENKERYYIPDFYLPDTDTYVEIKGFETNKDKAKWFYFPKKLLIIKSNDLKKLGIEI